MRVLRIKSAELEAVVFRATLTAKASGLPVVIKEYDGCVRSRFGSSVLRKSPCVPQGKPYIEAMPSGDVYWRVA